MNNKSLWLIIGISAAVIFVVLLMNNSPSLSPTQITSIAYSEFNIQVLPTISTGSYGMVQLTEGQLTPDNQFVAQSTYDFDTRMPNQAQALIEDIELLQARQATFQLATNLQGPMSTTYQVVPIEGGPKKDIDGSWRECECDVTISYKLKCIDENTGEEYYAESNESSGNGGTFEINAKSLTNIGCDNDSDCETDACYNVCVEKAKIKAVQATESWRRCTTDNVQIVSKSAKCISHR